MTKFDYRPETTSGKPAGEKFVQGSGQDPARYLVFDSNLYHPRPYLTSGIDTFYWPVGVEGLTDSGNATLSIHRYIGDDDADVQVIHRDESRIEMSGTFPGRHGIRSVQALKTIIRQTTPDIGKVLHLPGIFENVQYVTVENYSFNHGADDRTHSWDYSITFVRMGKGRRVRDPHGKPPPVNPSRKTVPKGKAGRYVRIKVGQVTFRQIAKKVYGNANKWHQLVDLNLKLVVGTGLPMWKIPTHRWKLGIRIYY